MRNWPKFNSSGITELRHQETRSKPEPFSPYKAKCFIDTGLDLLPLDNAGKDTKTVVQKVLGIKMNAGGFFFMKCFHYFCIALNFTVEK